MSKICRKIEVNVETHVLRCYSHSVRVNRTECEFLLRNVKKSFLHIQLLHTCLIEASSAIVLNFIKIYQKSIHLRKKYMLQFLMLIIKKNNFAVLLLNKISLLIPENLKSSRAFSIHIVSKIPFLIQRILRPSQRNDNTWV